MRQIDDGTIASRTRAINMWFEDFLEAVVRTATMKPLPTTQEIIFTGMSDAGDMLINLKVDEDKRANAYDRFLEEHAVVRGAPPAQDIEDLVDHMCFIIQRTVELRLGMRSLCAASSSPAHPSLHTRPTRAHGTPHTHARTRISATGLAGGARAQVEAERLRLPRGVQPGGEVGSSASWPHLPPGSADSAGPPHDVGGGDAVT